MSYHRCCGGLSIFYFSLQKIEIHMLTIYVIVIAKSQENKLS